MTDKISDCLTDTSLRNTTEHGGINRLRCVVKYEFSPYRTQKEPPLRRGSFLILAVIAVPGCTAADHNTGE